VGGIAALFGARYGLVIGGAAAGLVGLLYLFGHGRARSRPDPRDEGPAAGPVEAAGPAVLASRTVAGDLERAPTARP
jgi:hypothetical protein